MTRIGTIPTGRSLLSGAIASVKRFTSGMFEFVCFPPDRDQNRGRLALRFRANSARSRCPRNVGLDSDSDTAPQRTSRRPGTRHQVNESSPPQRCGVHGIVPQSSQFVVEQRYRNRAPSHFERGDVRTYQRPGDGKPALFQNAPRRVVHEIELERRSAAEAIDDQQNAA
jgi:hypothetical protein